MNPTRSLKFLLGSLLTVTLLAVAVLWSGCSSDGAGTIHIDSPKSRMQTMQPGAGPVPTATAKLSPSGPRRKSVQRVSIKNHVLKNR